MEGDGGSRAVPLLARAEPRGGCFISSKKSTSTTLPFFTRGSFTHYRVFNSPVPSAPDTGTPRFYTQNYNLSQLCNTHNTRLYVILYVWNVRTGHGRGAGAGGCRCGLCAKG